MVLLHVVADTWDSIIISKPIIDAVADTVAVIPYFGTPKHAVISNSVR